MGMEKDHPHIWRIAITTVWNERRVVDDVPQITIYCKDTECYATMPLEEGVARINLLEEEEWRRKHDD